ncbi:MAG: sialate O-acetylesterase, partial [Flavobacteriales bacterium]
MSKQLVLLSILVCFFCFTFGAVKLPPILASNMVLKQKSKVNIWGISTYGKKVTVQASWDNKTYSAVANKDGNWKVVVNTPGAGGPFKLTFDDGEKLVLDNILIGEVWVCSGQSNMGIPLKGLPNQPVKDSEALIAAANNSKLRMFSVKKTIATTPQEDCEGNWELTNPKNAPIFSAIAYQFGKLLQEKLGVPIGIIHSAYGGSPIRSWMGESYDEFASLYPNTVSDTTFKQPKVFYNGMIAPIFQFGINGFIWYQG